MLERGLTVDHTTVYRWVQAYAPELDKRCRPYLRQTLNSWRVDETYIEVKGEWKYLYRAVDSEGNTLDLPWHGGSIGGQSRDGVWLVQHSKTNFKRVRSNEHD